MSGHGAIPIFCNKKIKIERPEHSLTPHPSTSDSISFLPYPTPSKWTSYVYHSLYDELLCHIWINDLNLIDEYVEDASFPEGSPRKSFYFLNSINIDLALTFPWTNISNSDPSKFFEVALKIPLLPMIMEVFLDLSTYKADTVFNLHWKFRELFTCPKRNIDGSNNVVKVSSDNFPWPP